MFVRQEFTRLSIRHVEDADDARATLNENERDNRYLFMLLSLIEQLLFIEFSDRLTNDAKVSLHVASRTLTLPSNDSRVPKLNEMTRRRRGPNFELRREGGLVRIPFFHSVAEIEGAINYMIRYRWPNELAAAEKDGRVDFTLYLKSRFRTT